MPTSKEASANRAIFDAANKLSNDYARSGGAENRKDQISDFATSIIMALADLTAAYDDCALTDPAYIEHEIESVLQAVGVAFSDAVEVEEAMGPNFSAPYSTLYVQGGSVVG